MSTMEWHITYNNVVMTMKNNDKAVIEDPSKGCNEVNYSLAEINNVQRERDEFRRNAHRMTVRYNTDTERWRRRYGCVVRQAQNWKRQHRLQNQNFTHNINNLQQQILNLQNSPVVNPNMAAVHEIYQMLAPQLGLIPNYIGQFTPDEYIQKITNVFDSAATVITAANLANVGTFVDAHKCDILKSKMGDKFSPVPAADPYTVSNPTINTPTTFAVWLRHKYREVRTGNAELALLLLIQDSFNPTDSPDTYEARIRKHIVGFQDNQVLPVLYIHLPPALRSSVKIYMTIRGNANQTVDKFFAVLKKCWLEHQVGLIYGE